MEPIRNDLVVGKAMILKQFGHLMCSKMPFDEEICVGQAITREGCFSSFYYPVPGLEATNLVM